MREWLPSVLLAVLALLIVGAAWRKVDPRHEFIVSMLSELNGSTDPFAS